MIEPTPRPVPGRDWEDFSWNREEISAFFLVRIARKFLIRSWISTSWQFDKPNY